VSFHYARVVGCATINDSFVCAALALGSWLALVPAALIAATFTVRTALEDQVLQQELAGYGEYAQRVRYRLLPGMW